jgi:hypothetical protein
MSRMAHPCASPTGQPGLCYARVVLGLLIKTTGG